MSNDADRIQRLTDERDAALLDAGCLRSAITALAKDWDTYASGIEVTTVAGVRFGKLRDATRILRALCSPTADTDPAPES